MDETRKLVQLVRYTRHRIREAESNGRNAGEWRRVSHSMIQVLRKTVTGEIPPERLTGLNNLCGKIGKNTANPTNSLDKSLKFDKIKLGNPHMDGGPGSGNWGHKGVPGQLGGSAKGGGVQNRTGSSEAGYSSESKERATVSSASGGGSVSSSSNEGLESAKGSASSGSLHPKSGSKAAEDHDLGPGISKSAQAAYDKARESEAKITPKLQEIADGLSCEMRGLEYSVKTASSTRDKIERKRHDALNSSEAMPSDEEIVNGMWDLVRYTAVSPHDEMAGAARKFVEKLTEQGYTVTDLENKWLDANPYNGIHLGVVSSEGQKFELQIHSNESLAVKDKLHPLYEERRKVTTSEQRKAELDAEMMNLSKSMKRPKGIDDLENFRKEWNP